MKIDSARYFDPPSTQQVSITEKRSSCHILERSSRVTKGKIAILLTDLELSAISHVEYEASREEIVVHGRKFLDILKEWMAETLNMEVRITH